MTRLLKAEQPKIVDGSTSNRLGSLVDFAILTGVGPFTAVSTIGTIAQPNSVPPAVESLPNGIYSQQRSVCPTNEDHPPELLYGTDDYAQRMVFSGQLPSEVNDNHYEASQASNIRSGLGSTSASGTAGTDPDNSQLEAAVNNFCSLFEEASKKSEGSQVCTAIDKKNLLRHIHLVSEKLPEYKDQILAEVVEMLNNAVALTNGDQAWDTAALSEFLKEYFKQHTVDEKLDKDMQEYVEEAERSIAEGKTPKEMSKEVRDHSITVWATMIKKDIESRKDRAVWVVPALVLTFVLSIHYLGGRLKQRLDRR